MLRERKDLNNGFYEWRNDMIKALKSRVCFLIILSVTLVACGQKGALYIPGETRGNGQGAESER